MLILNTIMLLALSLLALSSGASGCSSKQNSNSQMQKPTPLVEKEKPSSSELKVLAEGHHSAINNPFVAVVRDPETYAALVKLDANLPKLDADFFNTKVVIAAFLGERNTGGYSVEISRGPIGILVLEKKPPPDAMVTQVITSPFKIVAVEDGSNAAIWLSPGDAWQRRTQSYRITNGKFTMSGGFAGITEEFGLAGEVGVIREGDIATFQFRVVGSGTTKKHSLADYATGTVGSDSNIKINQLSADSLVFQPNGGLSATGMFKDGGRKLLLNLLPRPSMIADGYNGQGSIEAEVGNSGTKR